MYNITAAWINLRVLDSAAINVDITPHAYVLYIPIERQSNDDICHKYITEVDQIDQF
jgi:hypothetical protein